jgi:hypothetical protein
LTVLLPGLNWTQDQEFSGCGSQRCLRFRKE